VRERWVVVAFIVLFSAAIVLTELSPPDPLNHTGIRTSEHTGTDDTTHEIIEAALVRQTEIAATAD